MHVSSLLGPWIALSEASGKGVARSCPLDKCMKRIGHRAIMQSMYGSILHILSSWALIAPGCVPSLPTCALHARMCLHAV